ncbi:SCO4848 family membrane protein [Arenivirga flava]|uniref:Uncharacterized protein n=1 Tax=Arenivirga flava TaxID=1930060 RepID=A0AA37XAC6_9MICO|nr:hypothetical protein [Arenivirga flava]GMA29699.1 hypothetical protein GCM10025874_29520 [Arenivirga flava]
MIVLLSVLLLVNAVWNVVVWPQFLKRVAKDARARDEHGKATPFLIVHVVLVSVSLALAVASGVAGIVGLLHA